MQQVKELEDSLQEVQAEKLALEGRAAESEAALKACMGRVADLEARVASAPESLSPKVCMVCLLSAPAESCLKVPRTLAIFNSYENHCLERLHGTHMQHARM